VAFALILGGSVLATRTGRRDAPGPEPAAGQDPAYLPEPGPARTSGRP
jgi:hypothetical protein